MSSGYAAASAAAASRRSERRGAAHRSALAEAARSRRRTETAAAAAAAAGVGVGVGGEAAAANRSESSTRSNSGTKSSTRSKSSTESKSKSKSEPKSKSKSESKSGQPSNRGGGGAGSLAVAEVELDLTEEELRRVRRILRRRDIPRTLVLGGEETEEEREGMEEEMEEEREGGDGGGHDGSGGGAITPPPPTASSSRRATSRPSIRDRVQTPGGIAVLPQNFLSPGGGGGTTKTKTTTTSPRTTTTPACLALSALVSPLGMGEEVRPVRTEGEQRELERREGRWVAARLRRVREELRRGEEEALEEEGAEERAEQVRWEVRRGADRAREEQRAAIRARAVGRGRRAGTRTVLGSVAAPPSRRLRRGGGSSKSTKTVWRVAGRELARAKGWTLRPSAEAAALTATVAPAPAPAPAPAHASSSSSSSSSGRTRTRRSSLSLSEAGQSTTRALARAMGKAQRNERLRRIAGRVAAEARRGGRALGAAKAVTRKSAPAAQQQQRQRPASSSSSRVPPTSEGQEAVAVEAEVARPTNLPNFRRITRIDSYDVAPDCSVPAEVRRRALLRGGAGEAKRRASLAGSRVGPLVSGGYRSARKVTKKVTKKGVRATSKGVRRIRKRIVRTAAARYSSGGGGSGGAVRERQEEEKEEAEVALEGDQGYEYEYEQQLENEHERTMDGTMESQAVPDWSLLYPPGDRTGLSTTVNRSTATSRAGTAGPAPAAGASFSLFDGEANSVAGIDHSGLTGTLFRQPPGTAARLDQVRSAMPREESFNYSYSPCSSTATDGAGREEEEEAQDKGDRGMDCPSNRLAAFLEQPFRRGEASPFGDGAAPEEGRREGTPPSSASSSPEANDSRFASPAGIPDQDCSTFQDASVSIMTPMVRLGSVFAGMSVTGQNAGTSQGAGRRNGRGGGGSLSSGSAPARPPLPRPTASGRTGASSLATSSVGMPSVTMGGTSSVASTLTDGSGTDSFKKIPFAGAQQHANPGETLLGGMASPESHASDSLLPSLDPESTQTSHRVPVQSTTVPGTDERSIIETVVSEHLLDAGTEDASSSSVENILSQTSSRDQISNHATVQDKIKSSKIPNKFQFADWNNGPDTTLVAKEPVTVNAKTGRVPSKLSVLPPNGVLVPSDYQFTPKEQREPAVTRTAEKQASFLFSPNNMGRAALKQMILEKKVRYGKTKSVLEKYKSITLGPRKSVDSNSSSSGRSSIGTYISEKRYSYNALDDDEKVTSADSKPSSDSQEPTVKTSGRKLRKQAATTSPQPDLSPGSSSEIASLPSPAEASSSSSVSQFKSMVHNSAVTPWKTKSPALRFKNARKKFGGNAKKAAEADPEEGPDLSTERRVPNDDNESQKDTPDERDGFEPEEQEVDIDDVAQSEAEAVADDKGLKSPSKDELIEDPSESGSPFESMVHLSAITPYKTKSPTKRFVAAKQAFGKAEKNTLGVGQKLTETDGRLKRNRSLRRKNPRRETGGEDALAPRKATLVNPLFKQAVPEDEEASCDPVADAKSLHSAQQLESAISSDDHSEISHMEGSLVSAESEDDFAALMKRDPGTTRVSVSSFATERRYTEEGSIVSLLQGSVSTIVRSSTSSVPPRRPALPRTSSGKRHHVRFSEPEHLASTQQPETQSDINIVFDDKENENERAKPPQPRFKASGKAAVDPTKSPAVLCLSPHNRTPLQARKWRQLAASAGSSSDKKSGSANKLRKRMSSGKKKMKKKIVTGKKTPLKAYKTRFDNTVGV